MLLFSFQEASVDNIKVLATFHKRFGFGYLENKTIFVNRDEHDYKL